jgi:magnesium-protoporphyrin O-methyltransferase
LIEKHLMSTKTVSYQERRGEIETYFDRTAAQAWARLTSTAPVGRIRASVRAGRDRMRSTLLSWLPDDLRGLRVLDAGCGTGALAVEAARRGAIVTAIDLSPTLVALAKERMPSDLGEGRITFLSGDMLDPALGEFEHVVAMDSIIHYNLDDAINVLNGLASRTTRSMVFTYVPANPMLVTMRAVGRLFPRGDRAPWVVPIAAHTLEKSLTEKVGAQGWHIGRTQRVSGGFYTSQALEITRP